MNTFVPALIGYLCGSIPFGLLLTRLAGLGDIRSVGSGNIGATNVLRTGNKTIAALTLFCDAMKGFVPVFAYLSYLSPVAAFAAAGGAMAGHIFPVWLGFKGGKGVATYIGILFALSWQLAIIFLALWLVCAFLSRISSLSALLATALLPVAAYLTGRTDLIAVFAILAAVIWVMHRANIGRLLAGTESRISFGKKP